MLRAMVREVAAGAIRFSGLPRLIRGIVTGNRATIVVYHDPSPEVLDRHLGYLTKRYTPITLDLLAESLHSGDWSGVPPRALVVTVDDGHKGNRRLGPVFAKHGVVPTIFLCSQIVGTNRAFWFQTCEDAFVQNAKNLPNRERLLRLVEHSGYTPTREYPETSALNESEMQELAPHVDFGAHTRFHPILTTCDDAECESEIRGSREELERRFGRPCRHFAYPNGDYTQREVDMIRDAGYRSARSTDVGWNGQDADPFRLRVTGVTDNASTSMLAVQVSGVVAYLRCVLAGNFRGITPKHVLRGAA